MMEKKTKTLIAENRRARFDYHIGETIEVGIMLTGSEVKSLRNGGSSIAESYASIEGGELWLINGHIPKYINGSSKTHEERRHRKLLASRREISRMIVASQREGMTLVPTQLYANENGKMKLELAIAKGKKAADKRETEAKRDWDRQKSRLLKQDLRA